MKKDLKHVITFESFSAKYDGEIIEEGILGDVMDKMMYSWNSEKNVEYAKQRGESFAKAGKVSREDFEKAKAVDFDPKNADSKPFLLAMAKIYGKSLSTTGHGQNAPSGLNNKVQK